MRTLERKKLCLQENCEPFHNVLLHKPSGGNNVGFALHDNDVSLPIIATKMGIRDKTSGNVLLDSGANDTLIRAEVAERLGLKDNPISTDLHVLSGDVQAHQTKVYKVMIYSVDQKSLGCWCSRDYQCSEGK